MPKVHLLIVDDDEGNALVSARSDRPLDVELAVEELPLSHATALVMLNAVAELPGVARIDS